MRLHSFLLYRLMQGLAYIYEKYSILRVTVGLFFALDLRYKLLTRGGYKGIIKLIVNVCCSVF